MPDQGAGSRIYQHSTAATSVTVSPQVPYSAVVRRLIIDKASAVGNWTVSIAGQECGNFRIDTVGNNNLLSAPSGAFPDQQDLFAFCANVLNDPMTFVIPTGCSMVITCDGTITADIAVAYEEFPQGAASNGGWNTPGFKNWYTVVSGHLTATGATTGEIQLATQRGLSFLPSFITGTVLPAGWQVDILGMFLEGGGRNTYSGAADHQSVTQYLAYIKNGQRLFTRTASDGIPNIGTASATGSANTVYKTDYGPFPPFQLVQMENWLPLDPPLQLRPGDLSQIYLDVTGDMTGGADYSHMYQSFLCKIRETA